ncbi:MAG TPA: T9SS type A sorting domain-containing protein [Saprospiraceae bacterium]|nr:T9SS type A sorting domain-containing protein [Saprospiraceae bacterium]
MIEMREIGMIILLSFVFSSAVNSQTYCDSKYNFVWIMGDMDTDTVTTDKYGGCEIDFNTSPPSYELHPKSVGISFQNASMSSKEGELIFYSNGCAVYNKLDVIMENGDSLNPGEVYEFGCPYSGYVGFQNMISIPDSYNDSIYYLFHISLQFNPNPNSIIVVQSQYLYYTKINMHLNSGYGKVVEKNIPILIDTNLITTPLTATKHANGHDWWLVTPDRWGNSFNLILLNESGPQYFGKQFIGINTSPIAEGGQGKFSPSGDRFAWYHPENGLFLYDFNRETGVLSNFEHIDIPFGDFISGGCEFSPSGRFLYVNHNTSLFQLDLMEENIQNSLTHIADYDGFGDPLPTAFFFMERTPNNKIIVNAVNGSQYLHVIQEPDSEGLACRFEQHSIKLPTINNFTLPHFPNYRLGQLGEPLCDSIWVSTDHGEVGVKGNQYKVAPNPAFDYLRIVSFENEYIKNIEVSLYDTHGSLVLSSKQTEIDLSDLTSGIYICRITDDTGYLQIEKVVVAH